MQRSTPETATLLENVRVFAIEDRTSPQRDSEKTGNGSKTVRRNQQIALIVKPDQAEKLRSAMSDGHVSLVLRNPPLLSAQADDSNADEDSVSATDADGHPTQPRIRMGHLVDGVSKVWAAWSSVTNKKRRVYTVEFIRGDKHEIVSFPNWSNEVK